MISRVLGFPRVINEKAARTVAAVVALAGVIALATGAHWLLVPLAYGFWARVLAGPRFSPLAQMATRSSPRAWARRATSPARPSASRRAWARRSRRSASWRSRSAGAR